MWLRRGSIVYLLGLKGDGGLEEGILEEVMVEGGSIPELQVL